MHRGPVGVSAVGFATRERPAEPMHARMHHSYADIAARVSHAEVSAGGSDGAPCGFLCISIAVR
jgi:hypothetical protein